MEQKKAILDYIEKRGSITNAEAVEALHIGRLASRVSELREMGFDLPMKRVKNALNGGYHGKYMLSLSDLERLQNEREG